MKFAQCLLVALALWMPAASFAAAVVMSARVEHTTPCEETAPEESSELNEMFLPSASAPLASGSAFNVQYDGHVRLDGHIAELHSPPPNPAALR